jgi:valyl-tRNA synthetase
LILATTRPETKFGDTAVAVHPDDKRYKDYVGKELEIEAVLGKAKIKVIEDRMVDPEFGTGVVKITPAHDFNDFETGQRHNLPMKQVIGFDGKMNEYAGKFAGLYVKQARKAIVEEMQKKGLIEKIDDKYVHRIGLCYKCKNVLEPLPLEQWFVKMEPLAKPAIDSVKKGKIKMFPSRHAIASLQFLENIRDWNISRQIAWGIRIPAWKNKKTGEWKVTEGDMPVGDDWQQDEDVFDTWFSSSQWPFATLQSLGKEDFETFYPTTVMETMYDILLFWVARMIMMGIYATGKEPFKDVVLHGMVKDPLGKKMSKSKGNVVNPLELVEKYGADSVRFALVYGTALGNDQALSFEKLEAMRKFSNKLWNMGRFIEIQIQDNNIDINERIKLDKSVIDKGEQEILLAKMNLIRIITKNINDYKFNFAAETLYEFVWHALADKYIEYSKTAKDKKQAMAVLTDVYRDCLKLLHPFMPFITEEIYQRLGYGKSIMIEKWPQYEQKESK